MPTNIDNWSVVFSKRSGKLKNRFFMFGGNFVLFFFLILANCIRGENCTGVKLVLHSFSKLSNLSKTQTCKLKWVNSETIKVWYHCQRAIPVS